MWDLQNFEAYVTSSPGYGRLTGNPGELYFKKAAAAAGTEAQRVDPAAVEAEKMEAEKAARPMQAGMGRISAEEFVGLAHREFLNLLNSPSLGESTHMPGRLNKRQVQMLCSRLIEALPESARQRLTETDRVLLSSLGEGKDGMDLEAAQGGAMLLYYATAGKWDDGQP